jgi:Zn-dependent protease with chaperone function
MNFFEHQKAAQSRTRMLIIYFVLAVLLINVAIYFAASAAILMADGYFDDGGEDPRVVELRQDRKGVARQLAAGEARDPDSAFVADRRERLREIDQQLAALGESAGFHWFNAERALWVALITLLVIGYGTFSKLGEVGRGGSAVAQMLGGRRVSPDTSDPGERRLFNVVEEMAIASGIPVPPVFIMDRERSINAFAAGMSTSDACVAVTRGCVDLLSRDELQGVVAHEFGHILAGDMKMNVRLIGVLHGILLIGVIGVGMLRAMFWGTYFGGATVSTGRDRRGRDPRLLIAIVALGVALMVIGFVGLFFGRIIKAAVSRQREFAADATAVKLTRHPQGIAGALARIGGYRVGSTIRHRNAELASHMYFGSGMNLASMFATHPPLEERISRIDPSFKGQIPKRQLPERPVWADEDPQAAAAFAKEQAAQGKTGPAVAALAGAGAASGAVPPPIPGSRRPGRRSFSATEAVNQVGSFGPEHIAAAQRTIREIPDRLRAAAHDPSLAAPLVFAMILDDDPKIQREQLNLIGREHGSQTSSHAENFRRDTDRLDPYARVPLAELCMPALAAGSRDDALRFGSTMQKLIWADGKVTLFEFAVEAVLMRPLALRHRLIPPPKVKYLSVRFLSGSIFQLLSVVSHLGSPDPAEARKAFNAGIKEARLGSIEPKFYALRDLGLDEVRAALQTLAQSAPAFKQRVIRALTTTITIDGEITLGEAELLRAVAASLDAPMPPILAAESPAA